ncbi:MAG: hypothetical protein ABI614_19660 [Planctomycetota bacterium]
MPESAIVIKTGPILALIAATRDLSLLSKLYSRVIVPQEVCDEVLASGGTKFGATEFASANGIERRTEPVEIGSLLSQLLDRGEASVVQLAISESVQRVCIDEHLPHGAAACRDSQLGLAHGCCRAFSAVHRRLGHVGRHAVLLGGRKRRRWQHRR